MDLQSFAHLLGRLKSQDNAQREEAEAHYKGIEAHIRAISLLQTISSAHSASQTETEIALFAAILLRRLITSDFSKFYPLLSVDDQKSFRSQLLHLLSSDISREPQMRRKICDAVAEVARGLSTANTDGPTWKELSEFVINALSGDEQHLRLCALMIIGDVPSVVDEEARRVPQIKALILRSIQQPSNDFELQKLATTSLIQYIQEVVIGDEERKAVKLFGDCMPIIYQVAAESVKRQEESILKALIELVEECPKLFRADIQPLFDFGISTIQSTDLPNDIRQLAVELLVTLCEATPQVVRKNSNMKIEPFVSSLLTMMADLEEDLDEWLSADENKTEEEDANSYVAESSIDRVAEALGGKVMLQPVMKMCQHFLQNEDWRFRHAALMAISATGEGLRKEMEKHLDEIVGVVQRYSTDRHPRVRYATCNAFGQLSTDFAPNFQKKFKNVVLDTLLTVLESDTETRVQAHAVAAMINFVEECDMKIISKFMERLLNALYRTLEAKFKEFSHNGRKLVLENVITVIASIADKAEDKFAPYYEKFMPYLKYIAQNIGQKEFRLLRGKAIECISLIGVSVPPERFFQDANDVMEMVLKTQSGQEELEADDVSYSYYISAWGRICTILGKDFARFLPTVMGPVMRVAEQKAEISVVDEDDVEDLEGSDEWTFMNLTGDKQQIGVRHAGLDEKCDALGLLATYAKELKEAFVEYVEPTVKLMVETLTFFIHEGCRQNAADAIPPLLVVAKARGEEYVSQMWKFVFPKLMQSLDDEPDADCMGDKLGCLAECISEIGPKGLNRDEITEVMKRMEQELQSYYKNAEERAKSRKDEDYDEEMEEGLDKDAKSDFYVLSRISDVLHHLFKTYGVSVLPQFEQIILSSLLKLAEPNRPYQELQWIVCTFDSVLQYCGENSAVYKNILIPLFKKGIIHDEAAVRQASAFGWGLMGQYGGDAYVAECVEIFPKLVEMINQEGSRSEANEGPTENCISSITRFFKYRPQIIERYGRVDEALVQWLTWLPVYADPDETPVVYGYLADLIEANHPSVVGQNYANLPRIVEIVAEALKEDALEDNEASNPIYNRLIAIVKHIQQDQTMFQNCVAGLNQEQQVALSQALNAPLRKVT